MSMNTPSSNSWKHLEPHPGSLYRQLFIKGTRIRAEVIYGPTVDGEPPYMTPEEIAADYDLPLEAVQEAIAYCETNAAIIMADHRREERLMEAHGMNDPDYKLG